MQISGGFKQGLKVSEGFALLKPAIIILTIVIVVLIVLINIKPPDAVSKNAAVSQFSSERAMEHLSFIAKKPHAMGSQAHLEVQRYIISNLTDLGIEPEIQSTFIVQDNQYTLSAGKPLRAATVQNIIVRIEGFDQSKSILVMAHYDTKTNTPGASDNSSSVSVILEMIRALIEGEDVFKNDVIFLLTDGEEYGLFGAKAFKDEHPWAEDVGLVLNIEGQGNQGPVFMFNTSEQNGWIVEQFARVVPYPFTTGSASRGIYTIAPVSTDFNEFKSIPGLDSLSIIGNEVYHAVTDTVERIDDRILQNHGENALALIRHAGNLNLNVSQAKDRIYFNTLGSGIVTYSYNWIVPLTFFIFLLFVVYLYLGIKNEKLIFKKLALAFFVYLFFLVIPVAVVTALAKLLLTHSGEFTLIKYCNPLVIQLYMVGSILLTVSLTVFGYYYFRQKCNNQHFLFSVHAWWMVLLIAITAWLPDLSYVIAWPLLFSLLGYGYTIISKSEKYHWVVLLIAHLPALVIFATTNYHIYISYGLGLIAGPIALLCLLLGLLVPIDYAISINRKWIFPTLTGAAGMILICGSSIIPAFDQNTPKPNTLIYAVDLDEGKSFWVSTDQELDEFTSQYLGAESGKRGLPNFYPLKEDLNAWVSETDSIVFKGTQIDVLKDVSEGHERELSLSLMPQKDAHTIGIYIELAGELLDIKINGKPLQPQVYHHIWGLHYWAPTSDGIKIQLKCSSTNPVRLRLVTQLDGLPENTTHGSIERPLHFMPRPSGTLPPYDYFTDSDMTIISELIYF